MNGFGSSLCFLIKRLMAALKVNDGMKDTVLQPTTGEFCEETLDGI
jgi:hypothetical protein